MKLIKVDQIDTINPASPDDLVICCASFEQRCKGVVNRLSSNYKAQNSIVFWYKETDLTNLRTYNMKEMERRLRTVSNTLEIVEAPRDEPIIGIRKLQEKCSQAKLSLSGKYITLDITTFTKQYTLVLLKLLNDLERENRIRVLYTEPKEYGPRLGGRLTRGLKKIVSVPFFGGRYRLDSKNLLILFLGYEGERAMAVWEEYGPEKTIAFIGKPGYREGWECISEDLNERLLSMPTIERRTIPTLDPLSVANELEKIQKEYKGYNMYVSPLGSKIQALGLYLFAMTRPEVQIVYAMPLVYLESEYSKGIGPTWQFYFEQTN